MLSRRLRRIVIVAIATCVVLGPAAAANADGGFGGVDCTQHPDAPDCKIKATDPGSPGSGGTSQGGGPGTGPGGSSDGCWLERLNDPSAPVGGPLPGAWYVRHCPLPGGGESVSAAFWQTGGPDPAVLAQEAVSRLRMPLPAIRANPSPPSPQLVFLPTWLWLAAESWAQRSATASVPGLSVTATAKPSRLTFTTGDGARVTCPGPGTAWAVGMDPNASSPDCGHTYALPGTYHLTATVTWTVTWTGGGQSGTVPDLTTSATTTVPVTDAPALN